MYFCLHSNYDLQRKSRHAYDSTHYMSLHDKSKPNKMHSKNKYKLLGDIPKF